MNSRVEHFFVFYIYESLSIERCHLARKNCAQTVFQLNNTLSSPKSCKIGKGDDKYSKYRKLLKSIKLLIIYNKL